MDKKSTKQSNNDIVWPWFILPILAWMAFSVIGIGLFAAAMPIWAAIPLGIIAGTIALMLVGFSNGTTLVEINISLGIVIVLLAFLVPVFSQARERALAEAHRHRTLASRSSERTLSPQRRYLSQNR